MRRLLLVSLAEGESGNVSTKQSEGELPKVRRFDNVYIELSIKLIYAKAFRSIIQTK